MTTATRDRVEGGASPRVVGPEGRPSGYRPHLDGIRAVAVLAVIAYHLGYPWMPAGFIGVDVFFVLSGYLITGLLLDEMTTTGRVRLVAFYARRARRLLPASLLVLGAVVALSRRVLDPLDQNLVGDDVRWSALYAANWRFVRADVDYFTEGDLGSPLQHFWSLAVEEQFYLVWPLLLFGLWRLGRRRSGEGRTAVPPTMLAVVSVLAAASLWTSLHLTGTNAGYFATHSRAYQLLAGALLAMAVRRWGHLLPLGSGAARAGTVLTGGGLVVLVWAMTTFDGAFSYPGTQAIVVTVASLAVLVGVDLLPRGPLTRVLGAAGPALVGRLSYSLYIWHWPVIVFTPVLAERWGQPGLDERWVVIAVTVVLSAASYWLFERPIRFRLLPRAPRSAVVAVGLTLSLLMAQLVAPVLRPEEDFATRAFEAAEDIPPTGDCPYSPQEWERAGDDVICVHRRGGPTTLALVGDSHAFQWQPAIDRIAEIHDLTVIRATRMACPVNDITVVGVDSSRHRFDDVACTEWRRTVYPRLIEEVDPDMIYVQTRSLDRWIVDDGERIEAGDDGHRDLWVDGWAPTMEMLTAGSGTVFLSRILPRLPEDVPACLAEHGPDGGECDLPVVEQDHLDSYNEVIDGLAGDDVAVVDPTPMVCPDRDVCPALMRGRIVHRDDDHLTASFARFLAPRFERMLTEAGADLG